MEISELFCQMKKEGKLSFVYVRILKRTMLTLLASFLIVILSLNNLQAQLNLKQKKNFSFNIKVGYQSFSNTEALDKALTANNFTTVATPHSIVAIEFAGMAKKNIIKTQFGAGNGLFVKKSGRPTLRTSSVSILYGRDILSEAERTYLYPFAGVRMLRYSLPGESSDGKSLKAKKDNYDIPVGIGLKHYFKSEVLYVFNNIDFNAAFTLPVVNGKWKDDGAEYVTGTYKLKPTFYFTAAIGF